MPPPDRPPGRGRGGGRQLFSRKETLALLLTVAFAISLFAVPSAQQSLHKSGKHPTLVASTHENQPSNARNEQAGRSPPEIPLLKHDITTVKFRSTEHDATHQNYNQALAPARNPSAVRAPLAHSESVAGLSALSSARLLQDWEAADMVLLATVDGRIQARNRRTGEQLWAMGFDDSPMIETIHHCHNNTEDDESQCDHDYMFIIEPTQDGAIWVQYKDPKIPLRRLDVSVKELAAQTPHSLDDPPLITISQQETSMVTVNAQTGKVISQFSKHAMGFSNNEDERKCRRITGLESDDNACDTKGNINLGRVEYTIQIANKLTSQKLCTIKYAEWTPNKADGDLQSQYTDPLDSQSIQTLYNGKIIGLDTASNRQARWNDKLESPVAQIFDIVKPLGNVEDDNSNLVLLSRTLGSPAHLSKQKWKHDPQRLERVFVDKGSSGSWYLLSELAYPGVTTGADRARIDSGIDSESVDFLGSSQDLVGVRTTTSARRDAEIMLTIDGSPSDKAIIPEPEKGVESVYLPTGEPKRMFSDFVPSPANIILLSIIVLIFGSRLNIPAVQKVYRHLSKVPILDSLLTPPTIPPAASPGEATEEVVIRVPAEKTPQEAALETFADAAPANPDVVEAPAAAITPTHSREESREMPGFGLTSLDREDSKEIDAKETASGDESDLEKVDTNVLDEANVPAADDGEAPRKKKPTRRGGRGRARKSKQKGSMPPEAMDNKTQAMEEWKDNLLQVGKLQMYPTQENILGTGSNGTTVYRGTLDGREVAVKRLIKSTNSLAAKEIKHLLSSDENPHVVRFFGKEESLNFTYIALDLFTTSLDQFVEKLDAFPSLVQPPEGFDVKDCLQQITDGVAHLHSLKLVHRDIKPQNVLVRPVKTLRPSPGLPRLQFVISDFGLCKALDDGPESTFAPTINHTAAGTTGWRAPELLVGNNEILVPTGATNTSTNNSVDEARDSSSGNLLAQPSGRRVTKAIDIFSLGCVFYFVMTQGCHPFDAQGSSLARDYNIKKGEHNMDALRLHDYQFDADDLILQMINPNPKCRPDTEGVLKHPYFWPHETKLDFLVAVSDGYENIKTSIPNIHKQDAERTPEDLANFEELKELEGIGCDVISKGDWTKALPQNFLNEAGTRRKYSGHKMIDLLRMVRNKKNHFQELPEDIKKTINDLGTEVVAGRKGGNRNAAVNSTVTAAAAAMVVPTDVTMKGYYEFWAKRFPSLLVNVHMLVVKREMVGQMRLGRYF